MDMKLKSLWRLMLALVLVGTMYFEMNAASNSGPQTNDQETTTDDEEDPVEIDPVVDPFSPEWILTILGL